MHQNSEHQKRARDFHSRAIEAFSRGKMQSACVALKNSGNEFRAAHDKANAALVEALIAFTDAEQARASLAIGDAHVAASRAWSAAHRAGHAPLAKEVERFEALLDAPVAANAGTKLDSSAISELLRSPHHIVVDGHRGNVFVSGKHVVDLATRPMLVDFLSLLGTSKTISSRALASEMFHVRSIGKAHEARLKSILTLIKRLAKGRLGDFDFVERSFSWTPKKPVIVLVPLAPLLEARVESLLSRGDAYTARALAKTLGVSISSVNKAISALEDLGTIGPKRRTKGATARVEIKWKARSAAFDLDRVQLF